LTDLDARENVVLKLRKGRWGVGFEMDKSLVLMSKKQNEYNIFIGKSKGNIL